jgi:hypothetical protein
MDLDRLIGRFERADDLTEHLSRSHYPNITIDVLETDSYIWEPYSIHYRASVTRLGINSMHRTSDSIFLVIRRCIKKVHWFFWNKTLSDQQGVEYRFALIRLHHF